MKENDFIVSSILNPTYDVGMLKAAGLNMDNTQMLSKDEYLKSNFIKNNEAFQNEDGVFSEQKFNEFYNDKLQQWKTFSGLPSGLHYDLFDYRQYREDKPQIINPNLQFSKILNPEESTIGYGWIGEFQESPLSSRELAQKNQIYDVANDTFLEYSPNDHALFSNPLQWFKDIFKEPLVLAAYDEDEEYLDPFDNQIKVHKKGDLKVNEQGKYYYETLNGRSLAGKKVLSGFDNLTIDGSALNKYDFFDSDDKEKSIGGTIMKTAVSILPLFISGPIATVYISALTARELIKTLPMIDGVFGTINNADTPFTRMANTLAGKALAATSSSSDYAQESNMNVENVSNLMSDVALQWGQQKAIAQAIQKLNGMKKLNLSAEQAAKRLYDTESVTFKNNALKQAETLRAAGRVDDAAAIESNISKVIGESSTWKTSQMGQAYIQNAYKEIEPQIKNINRLGADASLLYMALVSNTDVYSDLIDRGLTKREAAAVALGSTLGMFAVDRKGLGEVFFNELTSDGERAVRATLKNASSDWTKSFAEGVFSQASATARREAAPNIIKKYFNAGKELGNKLFTNFWEDIKYHSGGFMTKAVGEGLEEVSEEVVADISKQLYEIAADIKPIDTLFNDLTTTNINAFDNIGEDPENALKSLAARYGMNFFGGMLGGGIFYGVERFQNKDWTRNKGQDNMVDVVMKYGKQTALNVLDDMHNNGSLPGDSKLSADFTNDNDNNLIFLSANNDHVSQNDFIYNQIKWEIETIDKIIHESHLAMSDGQLFDQLTLSDMRYERLKQYLNGAEYQSGYKQKYLDLVNEFVSYQQQIDGLIATPVGSSDGDIEARKQKDKTIEKLTKLRDDALKKIELFKSGETAVDYMGKLLFEMDHSVNSSFYIATFDYWLKLNHHMTIEDFDNQSIDEQNKLKSDYLKYKESQQKLDADQAWENFKFFGDKIKTELTDIQDRVSEYNEYLKETDKLFNPQNGILSKIITVNPEDFTEDNENEEFKLSYDEQLNNETPEEYNDRNQRDGETDDDFKKRKLARYSQLQIEAANKYNNEANLQRLNAIRDFIENSYGLLDPQTKRHILLQIGMRQQDIIQHYIQQHKVSQLNNGKLISEFDDILSSVKTLDDLKDSKDRMLKSALQQEKSNIEKAVEKFSLLSKVFNPLYDTLESPIQIEYQDIVERLNQQAQHIRQIITNLKNKSILNDDYTVNEEQLQQQEADLSPLEKYYLDTIQDFSVFDGDPSNDNFDTDNSKARQAILQTLFDDESIIKELSQTKDGKLDSKAIIDSINSYQGEDITKFIVVEPYVDEDEGLVYSKYAYLDNSLENSQLSQQIESQILSKLSQVESSILSDQIYSAIEAIKHAKPIENPIIKIVHKLGLVFNRDVKSIDALLESLMDSMEKDGFKAFTLSEQQKQTLQEAEDLLNMALNYMVSAYNSRNISTLYPHNQLMNEIIQDHKLNMELMPVIDDTIAPLYSQQINNLLQEIEHWRYYDTLNAVNKSQQFINTDIKFTDAKLKFFDDHKLAFSKVSVTDKSGNIHEYNLLDGFETINDSDKFIKLTKIEQIFYNNIQKAMQETQKTFEEVMKQSGLNSIIFTNNDTLIEQTTCELNQEINTHKFTPMDIGMYLTMIACLSPNEYYSYMQSMNLYDNDDIAPLSIQQYVSRIGMAYVKNPSIYRSGLQWIANHATYGTTDSGKNPNPFLLEGLFISGNGGAGKTEVVLKTITSFMKDHLKIKKENLWVCAPKSQQYNKMGSITGGKTFSPDDLCKQLIGETVYDNLKNGINTTNLIDTRIGVDDKKFTTASKNLIYTLTTSKPSAIILDEATHFSTLQLSIISQYCAKENIPFIMLGDDYQSGYKNNEGIDENINQEKCFVGKTPRISLTLRDSNYQSQQNVYQLVQLIRKFNTIPDSVTREVLIQQALDDFKQLTISYYDNTELNGDLITKSISSELVDHLPKEVKNKKLTIGLLGSESTSGYDLLKAKFGDNLILINNEVALQGQEFDYIIIDTKWDEINTTNLDLQHATTLDFLKRFYTLKTRGKIGSIFIDDGVLSKIIPNTEHQRFQNTATNFGKDAKDKFRRHFKSQMSSLNIVPVQEQQVQQQSQETNKRVVPHADIGDDFLQSIMSGFWEDDFMSDPSSPVIQDDQASIATLHNEQADEETNLPETEGSFDYDEGLVFGESHMLGIPYEKNQEIIEWHLPDRSDGHILNDIEAFVTPEMLEKSTIINDGATKDKLVRSLLAFKSIFLYNIGITSDQFNSIYTDYYLEDIISREEIKNIINNKKYKLVVSKLDKNKHSFVGYSDLLLSKAAINGDGDHEALVYRIVVEFTTKNGEQARVTLGQLQDPNNLDNRKQEIQQAVNHRIKKLESAQSSFAKSQIDKLQNFINQFDTVKSVYKQNLDEARNAFENRTNQDSDEISLEIGDITFNGNTVLRTIQNALWLKEVDEYGNPIIPFEQVSQMRLDSFEKDEASLKAQTNFRRKNPYLKISPVYIYKYIQSDDENNGMQSIRGKAVIFVSRNMALKEERLLETWLSERDLEDSRRSVRMIILDNAGCTLSDLCNNEYDEIFRTKSSSGGSKYNKLPFENDYMGQRQLVALHNFRANLLLFQDYIRTWQNKYNISDNDIDIALQYLHEQYQIYANNTENPTETGFRNYVRDQQPENISIYEQIWEINDSCDPDNIKQFRLGVGNNNDWQIRMYDVQPGRTYTSEQIRIAQKAKKGQQYRNAINFICINMRGLEQIINIIDGIYNSFVTPLNIQIRDNIDDRTIGDKERINIGQAIITSLNQITGNTSAFSIVHGNTDSAKDVKLTKYLPIILVKIASRAMAYSKRDENGFLPAIGDKPARQWDWNLASTIKINEYDNSSDPPKLLATHTLYVKDIIEKYSGLIPKVLDLCFHGTSNTKGLIDSKLYGKIQTKVNSGQTYNSKVEPQSSDAYFPNGFLVDPKAEINGFQNGINVKNFGMFAECQSSMNPLFLVRVAVDMPRFTVKFHKRISEEQIGVEAQTNQTGSINIDVDQKFNALLIQQKVSFLQNSSFEDIPGFLQQIIQEQDLDTTNLSYEQDYNDIIISDGNKRIKYDPNTNIVTILDNGNNEDNQLLTRLQGYMISDDALQNKIVDYLIDQGLLIVENGKLNFKEGITNTDIYNEYISLLNEIDSEDIDNFEKYWDDLNIKECE